MKHKTRIINFLKDHFSNPNNHFTRIYYIKKIDTRKDFETKIHLLPFPVQITSGKRLLKTCVYQQQKLLRYNADRSAALMSFIDRDLEEPLE